MIPINKDWLPIIPSRCPYTDYYVNGMLRVLAQEKSIPLKSNQAGNERTGTKFSHTSHYFFSFLQWKVCNYGFKRLYRI